MYYYKIYLSEFDIEDRAFEYSFQAADLCSILADSSQCGCALNAAIEKIDFEEVAITAMLKPFEQLIDELQIGECDYSCESGDGDCLDVTFSFDDSSHAAMFGAAVRSRGLG
ncbi:hypothetical protein SAMN04487843_101373 [Methylobacterium sp. ap11]|nr:hypothetical protein SAMN04487843_101373 [Methylobacterium sp. ap11]